MTSADDLIRLVESLRAPYGYERSAKFAPGVLYDERCLLSMHRRALGPEPARALAAMAAALQAPKRLAVAIRDALPGAEVVHFGHEAGDGAVVRKLYFEYVSRARAAMAKGEPALVHLAYKWRPGAGEPVVARYVWRPCETATQAKSRIEARLPQAQAPRARAAALALVARCADLADKRGLNMLDVEEPGSPRASLDMNVYDANLTLGAVEDIAASAGEAFAIAPERLAATLGPFRDAALGHLATGLDRRGREFVTLYFGVEARAA